jgi:hypothetical protein
MPQFSKLDQLAERLGATWPNLAQARALSATKLADLTAATADIGSLDLSIVMFGSLARGELTPGSDPDWTLLVDGGADARHIDTGRRAKELIEAEFQKKPGAEGTFGSLCFSHSLVHEIGGGDDTNSNTTRRILLLLESEPVGEADAYERVVTAVLNRYLLEDSTFALRRARHHVPRFLLNDFARYWRTMAVDFAYKARKRSGKGAAIRNFKLRMSRKLIYVAGLLTCFSCQMKLAGGHAPDECTREQAECVSCLRAFMRKPPLEILAEFLEALGPDADAAARKILGSYDGFIGILADEGRAELEQLRAEDIDSEAFARPRELSHEFRDGLLDLFFNTSDELTSLTRLYGVF